MCKEAACKESEGGTSARAGSGKMADLATEGVDLLPIGEIDNGVRLGGTLGDEHDQADDLPVPESITRIIELAREYGEFVRPPRDLA